MTKSSHRKKSTPKLIEISKQWGGPALGLAGASLISSYPIAGITVVFVGFGIGIWEIITDSEITRGFRGLLFSSWLILLCIFCWYFFDFSPPRAEALVTAGYAPNSVIGGVTWKPEFAELRMVIHNPTDEDYSDIDLGMNPDVWIYRASILGDSHGCSLSVEPGGRKAEVTIAGQTGNDTVTGNNIFGEIDLHDTQGNSWMTVATDDGYRLECDKLRPSTTVQVMLVAVTLNGFGGCTPPPSAAPDQWDLKACDLKPSGGHQPSYEDVFGPKPVPHTVAVQGSYRFRNIRHSMRIILRTKA